MAIKFPTKKAAPAKIEPKKVNKKVEEDEELEEEEAAAEEEEAEESEEESEEAEESEEVEEADADEEDTEEDAEEEEAEEEEEDEEAPKKSAKKPLKVAPKKTVVATKKSAPVKKGIKTGSLASFGQKVSASKESFPFELTIGDETVKCDVPGKKPEPSKDDASGRMTRDQLMSICTFALNKATGKESSKKDVEFIFSVFEEVIKQVTEDYQISFMGKQLKRILIKERAYPALRSEDATLVPEHYELRYRRVCHENDGSADPIKIKAGKDGKPLQKKDGSYIPVK